MGLYLKALGWKVIGQNIECWGKGCIRAVLYNDTLQEVAQGGLGNHKV
ncbi:hypothetical protein [Helicobacter cinaedi]|nr:hypothetical protein [Helicobacter cinaedi]